MIQIDEKPDRPVCASHGPLRWGWFPDTKQGDRWVSFTLEPGGFLAPHVCDNPDQAPVRWQPDPLVAERARRGRALADAVLEGRRTVLDEEEESTA